MTNPRLLACMLCALTLAALSRADEPASSLIEFSIEDQFKAKHADTEFRDQVAVFLWADRKGGDHIDAWKTALHEALAPHIEDGVLHLRGIAHVKGAPFFVKGRIRKRFGEDPRQWTLLDWEGVWREAYQPAEEQIAIFVFAADGELVFRQSYSDLDAPSVDEAVAQAGALLAR